MMDAIFSNIVNLRLAESDAESMTKEANSISKDIRQYQNCEKSTIPKLIQEIKEIENKTYFSYPTLFSVAQILSDDYHESRYTVSKQLKLYSSQIFIKLNISSSIKCLHAYNYKYTEITFSVYTTGIINSKFKNFTLSAQRERKFTNENLKCFYSKPLLTPVTILSVLTVTKGSSIFIPIFNFISKMSHHYKTRLNVDLI